MYKHKFTFNSFIFIAIVLFGISSVFAQTGKIAGLLVDEMVKHLVLTVIRINVAVLDRLLAPIIGLGQHLDRLIRDPQRRQTAADALDFGHGFKHFHQLYRAWLAHKYPATWDLFGQARGNQALKRLA